MRLLLKKGGVLLGMTAGAVSAQEWVLTPDGKAKRYLHSAASLRALLLSSGFASAEVEAHERGLMGVSGGAGRAGGKLAQADAMAELASRALVEFTATA